MVCSRPTSQHTNALDVLERYDLDVLDAVKDQLQRGANGELSETSSVGAPAFKTVRQYVLEDGNTALAGAAGPLRQAGY